MAGQPVTVPGPAARDWRSLVFAPLGDGQRRRRGSDGVRLAVAALATVCAVLAVQSNSRPEEVIAGVLSPPPEGVRWLVDVFWIGGSFGTVAALLLLAAVRRRWDVLRDLAIAAGGALAVSGSLVLVLGAAGGRPHTVYFAGYHLSFPVLHVAVAVGVATVGLPYLARGVQRLIESVLALAISHGAVSPQTIVAGPGQETATLVDFRNGTSAASTFVLDQDLAGAMASAALAAGPQRTVESVVRVVPPEALSGALGHLRRAGLDPAVNLGLKGKKQLLDQLRTQTAQAAQISVPELAEPRRMSWSQVLVAAGTLIGGWALILTLINAAHSISTIRSAEWGWVVATFILCAASYFGTACADLGSVPGSLAFGRAVGLEVASTFTRLAGGTAAVVATDVRFFQQQGYSTAAAVTSGAVVSAASFIVKGALFLIAIPLAWSSFHFGKSLHQGSHSTILVLILAVVCVVGAVMAVILAVPRWRQRVTGKLRPRFATVRDDFRQLASQPSKIAQLFGGQVAAQLAVALALGAALHAFGAHLSLAALLIAVTVAGVLASASPAGGGMGVAEAGLILALTAGGIAKGDATAAVFVQRLFSAYLPPIAGWFTLMWMRRREYL